MNGKKKVLIVEDEQDIAHIVKDYLTISGYVATIAASGEAALEAVHEQKPNLIILDLTLPDIDGIELCRQLRTTTDEPILILSARQKDTDKVLGLGYGADDYMTKPFSFSELLARVQAHLRRMERIETKSAQGLLSFGSICIDRQAYKVRIGERDISLSAKEFELLYFLAEHHNQVFSKSRLLDAVWGYQTYGDENTIAVYIRRIREKFEDDPAKPVYLKTVWGVGYKFSTEGVQDGH